MILIKLVLVELDFVSDMSGGWDVWNLFGCGFEEVLEVVV